MASALLAVLVLGCGLETSGISAFDGASDVEDDAAGDWIPGEDARREDLGASEDVGWPDDGANPGDDGGDERDGDDEDDGGPIPDGCSIESCNGLDDDCDTRPDDGFACVLGTSELGCGPCGQGRRECTAECVWSECTYPLELCAPGTEEECVPASCEVGHRTCEPTCEWSACVADHSDCTPGATESCEIESCGTGSRTCRTDCSWNPCRYGCSRSWETCCPGIGCVNLDSDIQNCGACGHDCGSWSICWFGDCS
ncbi:MAG: hypothetical protein JXB32_17175 [Deltaproteobacteria bacterium]|nr:hypothetical protein [Deltaproteobacteria bacterium]